MTTNLTDRITLISQKVFDEYQKDVLATEGEPGRTNLEMIAWYLALGRLQSAFRQCMSNELGSLADNLNKSIKLNETLQKISKTSLPN